jgi:hypothetical protein
MKIDFIGPSYTLRSFNADCQKTVNLYPDVNEMGNGKSNIFLTGTPGLKEVIIPESTVSTNTIRAMFVNAKDDLYIVSGYAFIKIVYDPSTDEYLQTVIGNLNTNTGYVSIAENGLEIAIVDGDYYYLYNYDEETFSQYTPLGWLGSDYVVYFSSYFVFFKRNSRQFYWSAPLDGTKLDPLSFATKEGSADNIVSLLPINQMLWIFGSKSIEIYYNSGNADAPFATMDGGFIQFGCSSPKSVAVVNNLPFWLGRDNNGAGTIYTCNSSYQPVRISNFAVEYFIQNQDIITDAVAYTYQQEGHYFYVINFPSGNTTWVYDTTTQMWHERQYFNKNTGQPERHRSQLHAFYNNKHLVSDYSKNIIYNMSLNYYDDNGDEIQRIRRSPHQFGGELQRLAFKEFQLDLEVGTPNIENKAFKIMMRYSNDGGKTWSSWLENTLGQPGNFRKRVIWRRCGLARDRVWEVMVSDPVKTVWLNALAIVEDGV